MHPTYKGIFWSFFLLFCVSYVVQGQAVVADREVVRLYSTVLKESRTLYIYRPHVDSLHPATPCPVLYLFDGENHTHVVAEYCRYLTQWGFMPDLLVVGIDNSKNRNRDLTPTQSFYGYDGKLDTSSSWAYQNSGGNQTFFQFMEKELLPYVDAHYATQPFRILAGHSFGGISALNCMITHPNLFHAYIAASPSFWWDRTCMLTRIDSTLKKGSTWNKILCYSDGSEGIGLNTKFHDDILAFTQLLQQKQIKGLTYRYTAYPEEGHMAMPLKAYYDGIRFIYNHWEFKNDTVNATLLQAHYQQLSEKYGYPIKPNEDFIYGCASYLITTPQTLDDGIGILEMNMRHYPRSYQSCVALGDAYWKKKNTKKARFWYKNALQLNPKAEDVVTKLRTLSDNQ